ncbi:MAG: insulinase family protein [Sphingobacteriales bacterium]|nr:insulinase family protein [Sphingobacteriales bacterium]
MKKLLSVLTISFFIALFYPTKSNAQTKTATDGEFTYEYVENDPLNARVYTLKNGLKVYLSVNKDEPRIYGTISTRAGSKDDPRDATGLAHYLEHMLFKGTDKIGTTNWEAEKKLLDKIEELYEKHRLETNPEVKKAIYKQIDSISFIASGYAAPNEYDKMVSSLGAKGTNAFTSSDQTTYLNDIPANELEKWLELEAERFRMCVLRLFHTELEAVYEEFNMSQDRDGSKVYETMLQALFPTHPYHISTIGLGEHLKNPSMTRIYEFFNNFYVANNMAVVLAGDLDPSTTIRLVNKYFGNMRAGDVKRPTHAPEKNLEAPIVKEVNGTEAEYVQIAYRFDGAGSDDALKLRLVDAIVQNGKCGIMDLNLLQKQQILDGGCYYMAMNDYSTLVFTGTPREGQTLEAVKDLLLEQVEQLKQGKFENWLIDASLRNFKLREIKRMESNSGRVFTMLGSFIQDRPYQDIALEIEKLSKITKSDIVNLANQKLGNNYVVIYKRQGEDKNVMKVEKPPITQVKLDRSKQTEFLTNLISKKSDRLKPVFLDYKKDIKKLRLKNKIELNYVRNEINPTFNLYYILDMGDDNDKKLALAVEYLQYLGTKKYTPEQLKQEFYKLGLSFGVSTSEDQVYVSLSGLEESLQEGIKLFEHILANVKPDQEALNNMIDGILKQREDAKKDKNSIFSALYSYGEYGPKSPQTNILSASELKNITPQELIDQIKKLTSYKHYIFYYGQNTPEKVSKLLDKYHKVPKTLKAYPKPIVFKQQPTTATKVYFVN